MKKTLAVAIAFIIAGQAQATEVYKTDTSSIDLTGRAYAGEFLGTKNNGTEKSEKYGANNYIRFGAKGQTKINDQMTAIGVYEAQFKSQSTETAATESSNNITTRLAYGGVKATDFGTVTFGRQMGAVGTVAAWTDVALTDGYGNDGLGVKADQYGTYRAGEMLKYTGVFNDIQVDADYKFDSNGTDVNSDVTNASSTETMADIGAYGIAVSYNHPSGFSVGTGYNVAQRKTDGLNDAKLWIIGAKYDDKSWYAALNYDRGTDYFYSGTTSADISGLEAAFGYNFANGIGLMSTYNHMKQSVDGADDVTAVDYYTLGAQYKFNKNLRVMAEYRINNKDDGVNSSASKYAATTADGIQYKNDMQLAVRYDF
jgi:outer membrane pore protein E